MVEYIERDAAIEANIEYWTKQMDLLPKYEVDGYECYPASEANIILGHNKDLMGRIKAIPKADVVPAVRGKWIETNEGTFCDNCYKSPYDDGEYRIAGWRSDFCPHCGARMEVDNG